MKILKINQEIRQKIKLCTREQLLQIHYDLNEWRWNDLLGEKPDDFDNLPYLNYKLIHRLIRRKNKYDIIHPISVYICGMFSKKELLHYYSVICCGMTEAKFDKFWREHELRRYCYENNIRFV